MYDLIIRDATIISSTGRLVADIGIEDGKIAEHWDVVQEEIPAAESANGNAMTSFNLSGNEK